MRTSSYVPLRVNDRRTRRTATTRRTFLSGASLGAGSVLLSPLLRQLEAEEEGTEPRTTRFVFVVEGNGLNPTHVHPEGIPFTPREQRDTLESVPLAKLKLPAALQGVVEYKDRMTIIQGLSGRIAGGGHSNNFGALGAFDAQGNAASCGRAVDVTIDAALGKANPSIFPIVNLGISQNPRDTVIYNCSCWRTGQKLPTQCRPDLAFNAIFGSAAGGAAGNDFHAKQDLLDFLVDDIKRVESRVGSAGRQKLESYLTAYESLRDRQNRLAESRGRLADIAPVPDDKYVSPVETDRLDAHFDLAAAVLIGGLTNVVTIASGVGDPYFSIRFGGLNIGISKHAIGHAGNYGGLTWQEMAIKIRQFHFGLIGRLMKRLEAVPEGDGTMLDNTLIVYLSDAAEAHHSRCWEWPFVLLGDLNGRLKSAGQYLVYPDYGKPQHRTINNLYNTFLHAAGASRDGFGYPDPKLAHLDQSEPLSEVLAV